MDIPWQHRSSKNFPPPSTFRVQMLVSIYTFSAAASVLPAVPASGDIHTGKKKLCCTATAGLDRSAAFPRLTSDSAFKGQHVLLARCQATASSGGSLTAHKCTQRADRLNEPAGSYKGFILGEKSLREGSYHSPQPSEMRTWPAGFGVSSKATTGQGDVVLSCTRGGHQENFLTERRIRH